MNVTNSSIEERIASHLQLIGAIGYDGPGAGWTRLAFTSEEDEVHSYAAAVFSELGCRVFTDAFHNLYGILSGTGLSDCGIVMLGTHLDTVKNGGNYDGVVGFIVAVEAVRHLLLNDLPRPTIQFAVFRAEESTLFKKACLGSRAAFLGMDENTLALSFQNKGETFTLAQRIAAAGGSPAALARPTLQASSYRAYFETHIEQARVLERLARIDQTTDKQAPPSIIGIVTSIRAPQRCEWEISGDRSLELFAKCVIAVEACALLVNKFGLDVVATIGRVENFIQGPDKINAVPGYVEIPVFPLSESLVSRAKEAGWQRGCEVQAARVNDRSVLQVTGVTDHSGGAPMGPSNRRDALVAVCEIILRLPRNAFPPCSQIVFYSDVRSNSVAVRDLASDLIESAFKSLSLFERPSSDGSFTTVEKVRVTEKSEPLSSLSADLQQMIETEALSMGVEFTRLPSGAGHDAMMAALSGVPTAMMFIPSIDGVSHNPAETSRTKDIAQAVEIQAQLLSQVAICAAYR